MYLLLFDIDGTLLNTGGAGQRGMERALEAAFGITKPTENISAAGRTDRAITTDLFEFHDVELNDENWAAFLTEYYRQLPSALAELDGTLLPGIESILATLHDRDDVDLGLLTGNFHEGARLKTAHYGIEQYFAFGGYGDLHHDRNDVARAAMVAAGFRLRREIDPNKVWVIGDTPSDVHCGRAIDANVAAVATGFFDHETLQQAAPDLLFHDLSDPARLLDRLKS